MIKLLIKPKACGEGRVYTIHKGWKMIVAAARVKGSLLSPGPVGKNPSNKSVIC